MTQNPHTEPPRRSFASRTPAGTHPDQITYRSGFVTRHQVSGWRFVMRRIASGLALHDTRMLVDPLRTQTRSILTGALLVITGLLGCLVFSFIRPGGTPGDNPILADRDTAALYVRVNDELHPVLNLASARLIAGKPVNPVQVNAAALNTLPRGVTIGIPGAPERMVQGTGREADWTVCDSVGATDAGVSLLVGPPAGGAERAAALPADSAILVDNGAGIWLLRDGRRNLVDLGDRAVMTALGLGAQPPDVRPVSPGLFNAIPEGAPLAAPVIPGAGTPPQFPLPVPAPVGAVVVAYGAGNELRHYAVLPDGLQPISPVVAEVLRNTDSYGIPQPPQLTADDVARLPVSHLLDTTAFPPEPVGVVTAAAAPVSCVRWNEPAGAAESTLTLMAGAVLPVAGDPHPVELIPGAGAARVFMPPGTGYYVRTVGEQPAAPPAGALFWVSDIGTRFGIDGGDAEGTGKTAAALGLAGPPVDVPWSVLSLFSPGPALSPADALTAYAGTEKP